VGSGRGSGEGSEDGGDRLVGFQRCDGLGFILLQFGSLQMVGQNDGGSPGDEKVLNLGGGRSPGFFGGDVAFEGGAVDLNDVFLVPIEGGEQFVVLATGRVQAVVGEAVNGGPAIELALEVCFGGTT
jgi:hypothetical protein